MGWVEGKRKRKSYWKGGRWHTTKMARREEKKWGYEQTKDQEVQHRQWN